MKKVLAIVLVAVAAIAMTATVKADEYINPSQVPAALQAFVKDAFGKDVKIVAAERDREFGGYEYDVTLSNGAEVTWGVSEEWTEVDCERAQGNVPEVVVDDAIENHVSVTYPNQGIRKIERKNKGYEVTLRNGTELYYNANGKFIREDR